MQLEDKIRFALSTVRPMAEYTLPYLASVIGILGPDRGKHVGTALRCTLAGRHAVVTALHVQSKAMDQYSGFAISAGYGAPPQPVQGEVRHIEDELADLWVYFPPDDCPSSAPQLAYWPEERIDCSKDQLSTDYLFVHGFPAARSEFSLERSGVVSKSLPYGVMQRVESLPYGLKPFQFAVDFDPAEIIVEQGSPTELPDPRGLSGSPVWRVGASGRSARTWSPDWSSLVGIVTQWDPDSGILVATSATRISELLEKSEPREP